ncbi:MAG: dihydrofolate reductase family protein [Oscillospiraceae bacterium]|nr:dihydrofolate reductase family protein [Oscillospiraceae bacterium]
MKTQENRPYIICHMTQSVDGKVTGDFLSRRESAAAVDVYYQINRDYAADGFACGRVTMEGSFTGGWSPDLNVLDGKALPDSGSDFVSDKADGFYAVAFDRKGRLGWKGACIEDSDPGYDRAHIIEVLCKKTDSRYLAYLKSIGVSYIFAGDAELDLTLALSKLKRLFGIEKLLLEGGSIINGAFQRDGLIDEISLVIAPVAAEKEDKPLFSDSIYNSFVLKDVRQYPDSVVWLNYIR